MFRYETVKYEVLLRENNFELRHYENYYTEFVEETDTKRTSGLNQIFNYISGDNEEKVKIPMTVPVFNEMKKEKQTTEFFIPYGFSDREIPKPENPQIGIKEVNEHDAAVVIFSGTANETRIAENMEALKEWLKTKNYEAIGDYILARYNPPITIPALRRNEIIVPVKRI